MPAHPQVEKYLEEANAKARDGKFNAAFSLFEKALWRQHDNAKAHADFGSALMKAGRFPEAVEQLLKATEFDPASTLNIDELVESLQRDIRQEEDVKVFQKIVDDANRADLSHGWGQVLANLQRGDDAIEQFKKCLATDPELEIETLSLVQALSESKTIEEQVKGFQEHVDSLNNAHAWNTWGRTLLGLGRYAVAAKQLEQAANLKKNWAEPYLNWGTALTNLTDYQKAADVLGKALKCDEHSVDAYRGLGIVLEQIGEHQQAVANYQLAAATAPSSSYFSPWLESLRKLPNPDHAIAEYQQALEMNNVTESEYFGFGQFLRELSRLPESAIQFARSLAFDSQADAAFSLQEVLTDLPESQATLDAIQKIFDEANTADHYLAWGQILARLDETDRAQQQLSKALELHSEISYWSTVLLKDLVLAFKSSEDRQVAKNRIQTALAKMNRVKLEVAWAAILGTELNEFERALAIYRQILLTAPSTSQFTEDFTEALRRSPNLVSVLTEIQVSVNDAAKAVVFYHWALILINLGREKTAVQNLERAISLQLDFADAHLQLARRYDQQGSYTKSCRHFEKTWELRPVGSRVLFDWGNTLLKAGHREQAIQKFLHLIRNPDPFFRTMPLWVKPPKHSPGDAAITAAPEGLRALRDRLNWDDDVVGRFQQAFDETRNSDAYNQWGLLLTDIGKYEQALQQFKQAVDVDPDALESFSNLRRTLGMAGLSDERLADYEQLIIKYHNNADAYNTLGNFLYGLNWIEHAAQKYQQALERDTRDIFARSSLIDCLIATNDINLARTEAHRVLEHDPSNGAAYNCLSWGAFLDGNYDEVVKQCELGIENAQSLPLYLYNRCARALYKSGREDLARKKFEEAVERNPDNFLTHYQHGSLLMEMNRYDEANDAFQKALALKPDYPFTIHNLAAIPYDQGRYEEAYGKWLLAIKVYQEQGQLLTRVLEKDEFVDSNESVYQASLLLAIQHKHQEAEAVLKEGLEFDPYNPGILRSLAELNWEKKDEFVGNDSDTIRKKSDCHWQGMGYFQRAEKLLKERVNRYSNYYLLTDLGDLYLGHEDYEKARPCFEEALAKDNTAALAYARLGVINLREKQADKAIPLLQEAQKRNPDDLDVKSSLAEAYLRAEKLDDAETTYREVLNIAPNHVQSFIGLGELCTALGDKNDTDRYSEAIELFTRALEVAEQEKIRSKYLRAPEKAGVYYQLGYARVQSYESLGIRRDTKLLEQAQKDFANCVAFNPSHQKAKRAKEKIDKRLAFFSRDQLTETIGPRAIYRMSIMIFVMVQLAFYLAPFFNRPSLVVSDKSLQAVAKQASPEVLKTLETLKNQKFSSREELAGALQPLLKSDMETVKDAVLQNAEAVKPVEDFPDLPAGYYVLLTFGSLLFMVVGLYLPQILKLRVAGIELEKSSVDQAASTGTLGIGK